MQSELMMSFSVLIVDGLRGFFKPSLMIVVAKKTYLKDKAEESWLDNGIGENKNKVKVRDQ